ncbi:hypothetical protein DPEC_G00196760 [Dallia pectoralis]|uniref:Uncharacterized protein n=1 Tax=Dallia pectoralis TaxID=75939 RepID=A0ACC2G7P3_DALPE|nr:hypothetical protein DPEC_G00196760 [Dallia pectoralis]
MVTAEARGAGIACHQKPSHQPPNGKDGSLALFVKTRLIPNRVTLFCVPVTGTLIPLRSNKDVIAVRANHSPTDSPGSFGGPRSPLFGEPPPPLSDGPSLLS